MTNAWEEKLAGQHMLKPNPQKKKNKADIDLDTGANGISITKPAMIFLRQISEAYFADQFRVGNLIKQKAKSGKVLADDLIGKGPAKSFFIDNGKTGEDEKEKEDSDSEDDESGSEDGVVDAKEEAVIAEDEAYYSEKVERKSLVEMLNDIARDAGVPQSNPKYVFTATDFVPEKESTPGGSASSSGAKN
eukprot:g16503.t1